jgi:hypothetical protein
MTAQEAMARAVQALASVHDRQVDIATLNREVAELTASDVRRV